MKKNSLGLEGFLERSHSPERDEDLDVIERSEPVENGNKKEVYRGLRRDYIFAAEADSELRKIFWDLRDADRVVNTWIYTEGGEDLIKKEEVPRSFTEIVEEEGVEYAIKESVKVFEDIAEHGYAYCDLSPENIRFNSNGQAVAVDYLDQEATEPLENVDIKYAAAMSYDLFTRELDTMTLESLEQIEQYIDKYSKHVEAEEYTGEPLMDFAGLSFLQQS